MRQYRSNGILRPVGIWLILAATACAQTLIDWTPSTLVPDNNPVGVADTRNITFDAAAVITGLEVRLNLSGGWNGDLYGSLVHDSGFTVLLNRPGNTLLNPAGSGSSGMNITFSDSAATDIHTGIPNSGSVTGTWQPDARTADPLAVTNTSPRSAFLSSFNEAPVQGNWTLFLADNAAADTSTLNGWGLTIFSEIRPFAIWDSNSNTTGIGGAGTWTSSGSTWATSAVGTSTAAQTSTAQLVFQGAGGEVNVSGTVGPANGLRFATNGYSISGGTIQMSGANAASNSIEVGTGVTASISSTLTGTNGMSKTSEGTLTLSGANTYSGGTALSAGRLNLNNGSVGNATSSAIGTGAFTITGGSIDATVSGIVLGTNNILNLNGDFSFVGTNDLNLGNGAVNLNANRLITVDAGTLTIGGNITSAAFTISKQGNGTLKLTGSNDYTGTTTIDSGVLSIGNVAALGTGAAAVSIAGGSNLEYTGAGGTLSKDITVTSGTGTVSNTGGGTLDLSGILNKNGSILKLTGGTLLVSGQITGSAANSDLVVDNATVTLGAANDYNGPTFIRNSGTLNANVANALPTANGRTAVTFDGTGTSVLTLGVSQSVASLTSAGAATVTLNANTLTVGTASGSTSFAGAIDGTGGLTKDGASTQVLTGANTYTGTTTVSGGTLQVGDGGTTGTLGSTSSISVADGATLKTNRSDSITLGQAITGPGDVEIANTITGSTILGSNSNAYTGTTTVSGGSLQVGSSGTGKTGTGAVSVQNGSTILGTGVVQGTTFTAQNGSKIYGGDSTAASSHGTLTFTPVSASASTHSLQGSIILGISGATATNATFDGHAIGSGDYNALVDAVTGVGSHDRLVFNNPTSGSGYTLDFLNTTGKLEVVGSSFTPQKGQIFNLLDWGNLVTTNNFTGFTFNSGYLTGNGDEGTDLDLPNLDSGVSGLYWDVSRFTASGNIVVVPEPSRVLLLLTGLVAMVPRRRRSMRMPCVARTS
jgi:autotransporter-associated beta strand protein